MRMFNTEGLSREAMQEVYEVLLTQKLVQEHKIERLKAELATAICAIEDGKVKTLEELKNGLKNLFIYVETNHKLADILKLEQTGINLEAAEKIIDADAKLTKELQLEQMKNKEQEDREPPKPLHVVE